MEVQQNGCLHRCPLEGNSVASAPPAFLLTQLRFHQEINAYKTSLERPRKFVNTKNHHLYSLWKKDLCLSHDRYITVVELLTITACVTGSNPKFP
jgi:hypothetical protein